MTPIGLLQLLVGHLRGTVDASIDDDDAVVADELDENATAADRLNFSPTPVPVVELDETARAARAVYRGGALKGRRKRDAFPRVDLRRRRIVVMYHQTGFEVPSTSSVWTKVTAHGTVRPDAALLHLHPADVRLVAGNRVDRAPFHGVHCEIGGNFEANDGEGDWWSPETQGRGRASDLQIAAARWWGLSRVELLRSLGCDVVAILPHRVTGRDRHGRPNRGACCGSRLHAEVVEYVAAETGVPIAAPGFALGGKPVPEGWHGDHYRRCKATFRG